MIITLLEVVSKMFYTYVCYYNILLYYVDKIRTNYKIDTISIV